MTEQECTEYNRISGEIQRLSSEANRLRRSMLQNEEPLPDDPSDWLLGVGAGDEVIKDQILVIGQEVVRLRKALVEHRKKHE